MTFDLEGTFESNPAAGVFPGCGEIHQDIKWNNAARASFLANGGTLVPHAGFPAAHPANVWIEDRDTVGGRFGRRSGPFSSPIAASPTARDEYLNAAGVRDMRHGAVYRGRDTPRALAADTGRWTFMLLAFDMCNGGVQIGSADFVTIDW